MFLEKTSRKCWGEEISRIWRTQRFLRVRFAGLATHPPGGCRQSPSQGEASPGAHPGGHAARLSERWPTLHPGALPPPLPQPQRMQQFTLSIYYCSRSLCPPPLSLGRVCRLADWQEPAVSLVGASITPLSPPGLLVPGSGHSGTWHYYPRLPESLNLTVGDPADSG